MPFQRTHGSRLLPAAIFFAIVVSSCSVNQSMLIKADGSGTMSIRVDSSKLLRGYLENLAEVSGQSSQTIKDSTLFNIKEIRKGFESRPGITVSGISTPTQDSLKVDLAFRSIKDMFAADESLAGTGVAVFSDSDGKKTLALHLDKKNYSRLAGVFPVLADPVLAGMGPQPGDNVSEDEYLQMIEFSLGAEGPALLKKSFIVVTIRPEGEIVSQSGGTLSNGAVTFTIPLLRILVLDKPLDCSVSFK